MNPLRALIGLGFVLWFQVSVCEAQGNNRNYTVTSPVVLPRANPVLTTVTPQMVGIAANTCAGASTTNDRAAIVSAVGYGFGVTFSAGACLVGSNLTVSVPAVFSGGKIKPSNGVTVTFTGPTVLPASQVCDVSLGGHCDFTALATPSYPENFGCVADGTTNNITCLQETFAHSTANLYLSAAGIYHWTGGLVLTTARGLDIWGANVGALTTGFKCGTGAPWAYLVDEPSDAYLSTKNFCFQNGLAGAGYAVNFHNVDMDSDDRANVMTFLMGASISATCPGHTGSPCLAWNFNFYDGGDIGGMFQQWANENTFSGINFLGPNALVRGANIEIGTQATVQNQTFLGGAVLGNQASGSWLLYEYNDTGVGNIVGATTFNGTAFQNGWYGIHEAGINYSYIGVRPERIHETTTGSFLTEVGQASSHWIKEDLTGLSNALVQAFNGASCDTVFDESSGVHSCGQDFSYIFDGAAAYKSTTNSSVTGDGTSVTVIFDAATTNIGSAYNNVTGVWTAARTGFKTVSAAVQLCGFANDNTEVSMEFDTGAGLRYIVSDFSPYTITISGGACITVSGSSEIYLVAADTVKTVVTAGGHASKNVSVQGLISSTGRITYWSVTDKH